MEVSKYLGILNIKIKDTFSLISHRAFEWMLQHGGIPTDESYGTYMGIDARCHYNSTGVDMMFE